MWGWLKSVTYLLTDIPSNLPFRHLDFKNGKESLSANLKIFSFLAIFKERLSAAYLTENIFFSLEPVCNEIIVLEASQPYFFPLHWTLSSGLTDLWALFESPKICGFRWSDLLGGNLRSKKRRQEAESANWCVWGVGGGRYKIVWELKKFRFLSFFKSQLNFNENKFSPLLRPDICWQFSWWWWERQTGEELRESCRRWKVRKQTQEVSNKIQQTRNPTK